jgi:hypothetical protein
MKTFLTISLVMGSLVGLFPAEPVQAGVIRVALLLIGDGCEAQRHALAERLNHIHGIIALDARSVPDHVLIDAEETVVTAEQLVSRVNESLSSTSCKAEEMKSCITAQLPARPTSLGRHLPYGHFQY